MHNVAPPVNTSPVAVHMHPAYGWRMAKPPATQQAADPGLASLAEWLSARMHARGLNQVEMERLTGIDQTNISRYMKGKQAISDRVLPILEKAVQSTAPEKLARTAVKGRTPRGFNDTNVKGALTSPITGAHPSRASHDVPVWLAMPIDKGPLFLLQNAPSEFAWRPQPLGAARRSFMLRMPDESMSPWREANEPIYFDPDADIVSARHALLQFDIGAPQDSSLICRLLAPPRIGAPAKASLYNDRRKTVVPDAPVRRIIPAIEWSRLIPH